MSNKNPWNKCSTCGKFISIKDFERGAIRDSIETTSMGLYGELYENYWDDNTCLKCLEKEKKSNGR